MTAASPLSVAYIKNVSYIGVFFVTAEYLGFSVEVTSIFVSLMMLDVFTGVIRAYTLDGGRAIRSSIGTRGILAKVLLITALFSVALASKAVGIEAAPLANGAMNVLILSELYSILGNIRSIKTKQPKAEFDAVTWMLTQVKTLLEKTIK